jgi:hypothetical protein
MRIVQSETLFRCGLAVAAFVVACVAHEVLGHGGACLASGGKVMVLSSSLFRCAPPQTVVDAAGPIASLAVAAAAAIGLAMPVGAGLRRSFLAFVLAIAGFWFAGQLIVSAVSNTDDWSFVLRALAPRDSWPFWRFVMGSVGVTLYAMVLRRVGPELPTGSPLVAAYVAVGIVACISAAFYWPDPFSAMWQAALESFGASVGLLYLALGPVRVRRSAVHP